jgi:hypothetical protein
MHACLAELKSMLIVLERCAAVNPRGISLDDFGRVGSKLFTSKANSTYSSLRIYDSSTTAMGTSRDPGRRAYPQDIQLPHQVEGMFLPVYPTCLHHPNLQSDYESSSSRGLYPRTVATSSGIIAAQRCMMSRTWVMQGAWCALCSCSRS